MTQPQRPCPQRHVRAHRQDEPRNNHRPWTTASVDTLGPTAPPALAATIPLVARFAVHSRRRATGAAAVPEQESPPQSDDGGRSTQCCWPGVRWRTPAHLCRCPWSACPACGLVQSRASRRDSGISGGAERGARRTSVGTTRLTSLRRRGVAEAAHACSRGRAQLVSCAVAAPG